MSNIAQNLQKILSAIYGKDVRQAIHDSIEDCYNDGRSGATDLTARQMLAQISPSVNALIASNRALDTLELTVTDPIDSNFELYTSGVPLKLYITGNVVSLDGVLKTAGTIAGSSTEQLILSLSATLGAEFGDDAPKYYPQRKTRFVANGSGSAKFMLTVDTSSNVYFSRYNDYKDTSADYIVSVPSGSFVPIHAMWVCEGVPIDNAVGVVTDKTLSIEDMPADAKAVGDALGSASGGLTNEVKQALLDCFDHVAWSGTDGRDYCDALEDALYPPATLTSISAVYTQSGTVYDTDSLDSLKSDLVVTAHYDDSTTETVTSYTLSGTLTVGTSTITVSYGGKTTTFTVTVTEAPTLSSISAVYTQSGIVSPSDTLDSLKSDLVVTAHYSDSSTATVTTYTLSGTLTVGTSTITVSYGGKTTTFTVVVSESGLLYSLASLTTTTTDGSEEIATGVNPLNYTDLTIALTIDEVTDWTWVAYAIFSSGLTGIGNVFALQSSGNGNIDFKIGQTGMTISTDLIAKYNTSLANAPLVFTISNVNTQRPTVNAYGYISGDVVTKSWEITANRDIDTAQNIYIAPSTSHAYNIAKSFKGTLSNFKIYSRILTTDEINSYLAGA